jgi:hypothetical protein
MTKLVDENASRAILAYLRKVILPEAWLHLLKTLLHAQDARPRLRWVPFFFIPLPVALTSIPLAALPGALVDLVGIPAKKLGSRCWCAPLLPAPRSRWAGRCLRIMVAGNIRCYCHIRSGSLEGRIANQELVLLTQARLRLIGAIVSGHPLFQHLTKPLPYSIV